MTSVYYNHWAKTEGNPAYCRASVHDGGRSVGFHQCSRKPAVVREVNGKQYGFCNTHDPEKVAQKNAERRAKWDAESAARQASWALEARKKAALPTLVAAMKLIAEGHNDARGLAIETLAAVGDIA